MNKMKIITYIVVASAMLIGTACSSTSPEVAADPGTSNGVGMDAGATSATNAGSGTATDGASSGGAADVTAYTASFATMQDPAFLMNVASSNLLEIRTGQMAYQKATSPEVRKFAEMMVTQHIKANQMLKSVASPLGASLPQTMMPMHQAMADQLMNKSGKNFDKTYMDLIKTAHMLDVAMFEVKSKAAEIPAVQTFATNTLPMLREHQIMAQNLDSKVQ